MVLIQDLTQLLYAVWWGRDYLHSLNSQSDLGTCLWVLAYLVHVPMFNQPPLFQLFQNGWSVEVLIEEVEIGTEDSCVEQSLFYLRQILQVTHMGSCL